MVNELVDRPKGITIWVLIEIVTAIVLFIACAACFSGIAYNVFDATLRIPLEHLLEPYAGLNIDKIVFLLLTPVMFVVYGALFLLLGLVFLLTAVLLFFMKEMGRLLSVLDGILILLTIVGLIVGIPMIWYFRRSQTRAYFQ